MAEAYSSDSNDSTDEEVESFMRGFEYLWNCAICLRPAHCGVSLEEQFRDIDSLFQYTFYDPTEKVYWLRCPYCLHSFHKNCATNLRLGELEYYGWACCREVDYTVFRGGLIRNRDVLGYIRVNYLLSFSVTFSVKLVLVLSIDRLFLFLFQLMSTLNRFSQ